MKILMVCLGNICRSPLAHGIMENLVRERGLDWTVDSAGTGDWHIGKGPDHRSVRVAARFGVDISGQICCQFQQADFDKYDRIYVMDKMNYRDVSAMSRNKKDRQKIRLLLEDESVPDPYWDDDLFEPVFHLIKEACEEIVERETHT